jgi:tetratricopeptide (TPR) repeat protein
MWHRQSLETDELAALEATIERRFDRCLDMADRPEAGRNSYTLGNLLRSRHQSQRAVEAYDRAMVYDPAYQARAYFHEERVGALFGAERFHESAEEYALARELGAPDRISVLLADALMFAGRYGEALSAFGAYSPSEPDDAVDEWGLKELFLDRLTTEMDILSQDRDPSAATALMEQLNFETTPSAQLVGALHTALRHDALSNVAWFNLGRAHLDLRDEQAALADYLGAAVSRRWDGEAWLNVWALAMRRSETIPLAASALACGARAAGQDFRRHLVRWTGAQPANFNGDAVLAKMDELLEKLTPKAGSGQLLRLIDCEGHVTEVAMGGAAEAEAFGVQDVG